MKRGHIIIFLIYILSGLYFINAAASFYVIPDSVLQFESYIVLVGGILLILGGINYLRVSGKKHPSIQG